MNNVNGILLVIAAMAGFTIEDMFIKKLSATIPVGQILVLLGLGSATIFAFLARARGHALMASAAWQRLSLVRAGCEACGALAFTSALWLVDISVVAAVFQATPLAITMGAALFMGEEVGWRRWSAIGLGFCGVLLIIRPGFEGFDPAALLVLISVVFIAARDLVTRRIDASVSSLIVSFQGFAVLVPSGALLLMVSGGQPQAMDSTELLMIFGGIVFGAFGYYGIVLAMRISDASAVTPFRYTRLLFSLLVGVIVFGEDPDTLTLIGATLIIATGLYSFLREGRLAQLAAPPAS